LRAGTATVVPARTGPAQIGSGDVKVWVAPPPDPGVVVVVEPGGIRTEWPGIAAEKVRDVSGNGAYEA
jgi:hypothetical protein